MCISSIGMELDESDPHGRLFLFGMFRGQQLFPYGTYAIHSLRDPPSAHSTSYTDTPAP